MSRQLKLSATLSVLAMGLFALVASHAPGESQGLTVPHPGISASMPALPTLGDLLPAQQ